MTTVWIMFIVAFAAALIATRVVMAVAWKFGILDQPDGLRKIHIAPIPRIGGIAIYVAFCVPLVLLVIFRELSTMSGLLTERQNQIYLLLGGAFLALLLGLIDDIMRLRPFWKLVWQILIAGVMYKLGFGIEQISNPFGAPLEFGLLAFPVTLLWYVGCMNAVNLVDGLDGLAAGTVLFVCVTLFLVGLEFNNNLGSLLMASLGGAILGFLFFNFPPARIFLGDSGSMLLGFLVATLSLVGTNRKAETAVALFVPVVALGLPIFDTMLAILRRWYKNLPISTPDREHVHHLLLALGWSHRRAVITLYITCIVLGVTALLITVSRSEVVLIIVGSLLLAFMVFARIFSGVRLSDVMSKLSQDEIGRESQARARMLVEKVADQILVADSLHQIWEFSVVVFSEIGVERVVLNISSDTPGIDAKVLHWQKDPAASEPIDMDTIICRSVLCSDGKIFGTLEVERREGATLMFEEVHVIMNILRKAISERIAGIAAAHTKK